MNARGKVQDGHCCLFRLRWSSGWTKTTRSKSFLSTSSLFVVYASVMSYNLSSVSLSITDCASCVVPTCWREKSTVGGSGQEQHSLRSFGRQQTPAPSPYGTLQSPLQPQCVHPSTAAPGLRDMQVKVKKHTRQLLEYSSTYIGGPVARLWQPPSRLRGESGYFGIVA